MTNKLTKRRYNNLLTGRNHYFDKGDFLFKPDESGKVTNRSFNNLSELGEGIVKAGGAAVGQVGGGLIGGGLQSGAGDVFQSLSGIASAIPGPWGAVASAGLGLVGGITNRLFGSKMNTENIAKVESNINALNSFQSNASDFDTLSQNWANAATGMTFSDSFIGKDGLFSNKASKKAADLRNQIAAGELWVQNSLNNNAENISNTQMQNLLANYTAYGGPLFAKGGRIHIKPENRGKFTETKRRTGKTTEELTHSKNPVTRKRAIFAQNAKKWHHAFGGDLMTHGANFDTGVTLVGNGGTHEENPNEGVPMGMDAEGVPNLVEEGEVIFNDYVFSNRLKVPKAVRKKYKLRGTKPLTFADAAIQMSKESEERPNDPISKAGLEDSMMKLMMEQEQIRQRMPDRQSGRRHDWGGFTNDYSQGLALRYPGMSQADRDQMVLQNIYNNTGKPLGLDIPKPEFTLPGMVPSTTKQETAFGTIETPTGFYESAPLYEPKELNLNPIKPIEDTVEPVIKPPAMAPTWMRYIPAAASGVMSITDALGWTNKPDYSEADAVLEASKSAGVYNPVKFNPIGNYLTYRPFDRDYYTNKLNATAGATRRNILNTSGGNRAQAIAGLLAADYNTQGKMGDLFRQAEEYNLAQRQKVEEFNRATDMFNSEGMFKADQANQSALMQARSSYLKGAITAAELRQRERQASTASRSANLSNFINSLGDIGRENFSRNMITGDPSKYYYLDANGMPVYKKAYYDLDEAGQDYISGRATRESNNKNSKKKSRGGYLTIRRGRK